MISLACEKIVRADVGEYSQIRAKVLLMQSKKNKKNSPTALQPEALT